MYLLKKSASSVGQSHAFVMRATSAAALALCLPVAASANTALMASRTMAESMPSNQPTFSRDVLYSRMQSLWSQHLEWTYAAVTAYITGSPALQATAAASCRTRWISATPFKPFYGDAAGDALAKLLPQHIADAVEVVKQAKAGNKPA